MKQNEGPIQISIDVSRVLGIRHGRSSKTKGVDRRAVENAGWDRDQGGKTWV